MDTAYQSAFFKILSDLRDNKELCDIKVTTGSRAFNLHKCVLAASSGYFHIVLTSTTQDSNNNIHMKNIPASVFALLVDYMYSGVIQIAPNKLAELYKGAKILMLKSLVDWCQDTMINNITHDSCLDYALLAHKYKLQCLEESIDAFIVKRFSALCRNEMFVEIPFETLCRVLCSDELACSSEFQVYEVFRKWLQFNDEYRQQAVEVMQNIRFALIPNDKINELAGEDDLMVDGERLKYLQKAMDFKGDIKRQPLLAGTFSTPRNTASLIVLGGSLVTSNEWLNDPSCFLDVVQSIDMANGKECKTNRIQTLPSKRAGAVMVTFNNFVFCIGGVRIMIGRNPPKRVCETAMLRFNPLDNVWIPRAQIPTGVFVPAAEIVDHNIYVMGGCNSVSAILPLVQCYHIGEDRWSVCDDLPYVQIGAGSCVINDSIYLAGGLTSNFQKMARIIKWKPSSGPQWSIAGNMTEARSGLAMCSVGHVAYLAGGTKYGCRDPMSLFERFDTITGQCTVLTPMPFQRSSMSAVFYAGIIYIPGGKGMTVDGGAEPSNTVLMYDTEQEQWSISEVKLTQPVLDAYATSIILPPYV